MGKIRSAGGRDIDYFNLRRAFRRLKGTRRGFTLLELLVVLTVILVLSTIAIYLYQRSLAFAKETVCQTNQMALHEAITVYATENDALPASLGDLKLEHLEKGYAKAMQEKGWLIKACTFLIKLDASDHAHAQFLTYENLEEYGAGKEIFRCPADPDGGASYGINSDIEGQSWAALDRDTIIVADSDNYTFSAIDQLSQRHRNKAFAVRKSGNMVKVKDGQVVSIEKNEVTAEADDGDETICHNSGKPGERTMTVSKSQLSGHLGHGDTMGACGGH